MLQKFGPSDEAKELFQNAAKHSEEGKFLSTTASFFFTLIQLLTLGNVAVLVEGVYVVSEVIRFTERLLNTALTSSSDISLVVHSLQFYSWVRNCYCFLSTSSTLDKLYLNKLFNSLSMLKWNTNYRFEPSANLSPSTWLCFHQHR